MDEIFKRINSIRNKVEEKSFKTIYNFFQDNWLEISKENYTFALKKLWKNYDNSYCKYVYFIKKYFYKTKLWK